MTFLSESTDFMWSKSAKGNIFLTTRDLWILALNVPMQNLTVQQLFVDGDHVEQCSMIVQELFETKNRATSNVICQFYGWLVLHISHSSSPAIVFAQNGF